MHHHGHVGFRLRFSNSSLKAGLRRAPIQSSPPSRGLRNFSTPSFSMTSTPAASILISSSSLPSSPPRILKDLGRPLLRLHDFSRPVLAEIAHAVPINVQQGEQAE